MMNTKINNIDRMLTTKERASVQSRPINGVNSHAIPGFAWEIDEIIK
jgi:hypothetical protein